MRDAFRHPEQLAVVLIETYWNVNSVGIEVLNALAAGINRNILECKCFSLYGLISCIIVLIETYWNVNMTPAQTGRNEKVY